MESLSGYQVQYDGKSYRRTSRRTLVKMPSVHSRVVGSKLPYRASLPVAINDSPLDNKCTRDERRSIKRIQQYCNFDPTGGRHAESALTAEFIRGEPPLLRGRRPHPIQHTTLNGRRQRKLLLILYVVPRTTLPCHRSFNGSIGMDEKAGTDLVLISTPSDWVTILLLKHTARFKWNTEQTRAR